MTTLQTEVRGSPAVVTATDEDSTTSYCSRSFLKSQLFNPQQQRAKTRHPVVEGRTAAWKSLTQLLLSSVPLPIIWNVAGQETRAGCREEKKWFLGKLPPCTFVLHITTNCQREVCKSFVSYKDYHDNIVSLLERICSFFFAALCWMVNFNLNV